MLLHYFLVVGSLPCSQGFSTVAGRTFKSRLSCGGRGGKGGRERVRVREKESFSVLLTGCKVCGNLTDWGGGGGDGKVHIDRSPKPVVSSQFHFSTIPENSLVKKTEKGNQLKILGIPENEMILFLILGILGNSREQEHFYGKRLPKLTSS